MVRNVSARPATLIFVNRGECSVTARELPEFLGRAGGNRELRLLLGIYLGLLNVVHENLRRSPEMTQVCSREIAQTCLASVSETLLAQSRFVWPACSSFWRSRASL